MTLFYALVFFLATGWHVIVADSQSMCDYWLASNATRLHGATYANGVTEWEEAAGSHRCLRVTRGTPAAGR